MAFGHWVARRRRGPVVVTRRRARRLPPPSRSAPSHHWYAERFGQYALNWVRSAHNEDGDRMAAKWARLAAHHAAPVRRAVAAPRDEEPTTP